MSPVPIPLSIRNLAHRLRRRLSPRLRRERASKAAAEAFLRAGFSECAAVSLRGEIEQLVFAGGRSTIVLRDGRRFRFDPSDRLLHLYSLPVTGEFERKETEFLRRLVKPGDVCIDAGASFGWYTVLFSRLAGEKGRVHALEPIPRTAAALRENLLLNGCGNVVVHEVAVASEDGSAELFVADIGVSGSLRLHAYRRSFETFRCPTRSLDSLASEQGWPRVDLIKADIEGGEFNLLIGAEALLRKWRPVLLLEVQESSTRLFDYQPRALFQWLQKADYRAAWVQADGSLAFCTGAESPLPDYNFIFLPAERAEAWA